MFTAIVGPLNYTTPFNTGNSWEMGDCPKGLVDKANAMFNELYAIVPLAGPQGPQGIPGTNGTNGAAGTAGANGAAGSNGAAGVNAFGAPNVVTPAFGTAYAATDPTKPCVVSAMIETNYSITIAGTQTDTVELRIGPVQATVANGTGGTAVATFKASLTGITITIGLGNINRNQLTAFLPVGWFYALRRVAGTTATIQGATDQAVG